MVLARGCRRHPSDQQAAASSHAQRRQHERQAPLVGRVAHERRRGRRRRRAAVEQRGTGRAGPVAPPARRRRGRSWPRRPRRCTRRRTRWRWPAAPGAPPPRPAAAATAARAPQASTTPVPKRSTSAPERVLVVTVPTSATASRAPKAPWPIPRASSASAAVTARCRRTARAPRRRCPRSERRWCVQVTGGGMRTATLGPDAARGPDRSHARPSSARPRRSTPPTPTCGRSRALARIDAGAYGRCAVCNATITAESLAADPLTRTCTTPNPSARPAEPVSRAPRGPGRPGPFAMRNPVARSCRGKRSASAWKAGEWFASTRWASSCTTTRRRPSPGTPGLVTRCGWCRPAGCRTPSAAAGCRPNGWTRARQVVAGREARRPAARSISGPQLPFEPLAHHLDPVALLGLRHPGREEPRMRPSTTDACTVLRRRRADDLDLQARRPREG